LRDFYPFTHRYAEGELPTYKLGGTIADPSGQPLPDVPVTITSADGQTRHTTTDLAGRYVVSDLTPGSYVVVPDEATHEMIGATDHQIEVRSPLDVDFVANAHGFSISGRVLDEAGEPLPGVEVTIDGAKGYQARSTTNTDGVFVASALAAGSYTLAATKTGYTFAAADGSAHVEIADGSVGAKDFRAFPTGRLISGTIRDERGAPMVGVPVGLAGATDQRDGVTSSNGRYVFSGVDDGKYVVLPHQPGHHIMPVTGTVLVTLAGANVVGKDFEGAPLGQYSISGFVYDAGQPLEGVTIDVYSYQGKVRTTHTGDDGFFRVDALQDDQYLVLPRKVGHRLQAVSGTVFRRIRGASLIDVNFRGY
jgi:protocatechuate 3,4-dioxygenase beta subunit